MNSGDGIATASWPAAAFPAPVVVTLTPAAQPPDPNGYSVHLTVTEADNQAPLDGFGAPVTVHLLKPAAGLTPAFSTDGTAWTPITKLDLDRSDREPADGLQPRSGRDRRDPDARAGLVRPDRRYDAAARAARHRSPAAHRPLPTLAGAATDAGGIASYAVLRNGSPIAKTLPTGRSAAIRKPGLGAQTVYRVQATDNAGNVGAASSAVVVLTKKRPTGLPRAIPRWAFGLFAFQRHQGTRPKTAPKHPPAWYWKWAGWRAQPLRLR